MDQATRDDYEKLMNPLLDFAQQQLRKHGGFHPFAAKLTTQGDLVLVDASLVPAAPTADAIREQLRAVFAREAESGEIRAYAIAHDGYVSRPDGTGRSDAILLELEHRVGDPADLAMPYEKSRLRGYRFGELIASQGERHVFPATTVA